MPSPPVGLRQGPLEHNASSRSIVALPFRFHHRMLESLLTIIEHCDHITIEDMEGINGPLVTSQCLGSNCPEIKPPRLSNGYDGSVKSPKSAVIRVSVEFTLHFREVTKITNEKFTAQSPSG